MITRIEQGTPEERFTGFAPVVLAQTDWYGQQAYIMQRLSDGRLFLIYPRGMADEAMEQMERRFEEMAW